MDERLHHRRLPDAPRSPWRRPCRCAPDRPLHRADARHRGAHRRGCDPRAAVLAAGWPIEIAGVSLNRFCGSGQTAVNLAAQGAASGAYDLVYAGGVESMSRCPMGSDMGPLPPSLTERYNLVPQGISAEMIAERWNYSREQLDGFALESQRRAWHAIQEGRFEKSLVPVANAPQADGSQKTVEVDE